MCYFPSVWSIWPYVSQFLFILRFCMKKEVCQFQSNLTEKGLVNKGFNI